MKMTEVTKLDSGWQVKFFESDEYSETYIFATEAQARLAAYHYLTDYEDHLPFED
jgi:hypothetical protein